MAYSRSSFTIQVSGQILVLASVKRNGVSQTVYSNAGQNYWVALA